MHIVSIPQPAVLVDHSRKQSQPTTRVRISKNGNCPIHKYLQRKPAGLRQRGAKEIGSSGSDDRHADDAGPELSARPDCQDPLHNVAWL
jgi:hypothetical protein